MALVLALGLPLLAAADTPPAATWITLAALPEKLSNPVFALAVDPSNSQVVLAGTSSGSLYRSADGGVTWTPVRRDLGRGILSLAFNPFRPGHVLAGTRGGGIWKSADSGATWTVQPGAERLSARAFGFGRSLIAAGTDHGVALSRQDGPWALSGLDQVSVSSVALPAVNEPARLVAGGDASRGTEPLPLYLSPDSGGTWSALAGPTSASSMVVGLVAGPLPPKVDTRPLLMGTNTAAYVSIDNGTSWQQLSGIGNLPNGDFGLMAFAAGRSDRFYLGSDGGASDRGGLWTTADGGQRFISLNSPLPTVTALAVSSDQDNPLLYVATFRPSDHRVFLWRLRDTGQPVSGPAEPLPSPAVPAAAGGVPAGPSHDLLVALLTGPEAPFLVLSMGAMLVVLLALVAYFRRGRG